jgi:trk system potassium uptake protein TrkH
LHAGGFFNDSGEVLRFTVFYTFGSWTNSGFASTTSSFSYHIIPGGTAIYAGHTFTVLLIILMLIGGGAGSSAGGIKQYRVAVAIRSLYYSLRYRFASIHERYPRVITRYGETKELDEGTIHEAHHYIFLFFGMFMVLTLVLLFVDPAHYDLESAAFDMASAVSNTGLSWVIGPAYVSSHSVASFVTLWAMSIGMLLGRLEILPAAYAVANVHAEIHYKRGLRQRARREAEALKMMEEGE